MEKVFNSWTELANIDIIPAGIKFIICDIQDFRIYMSSEAPQNSYECKKLLKSIRISKKVREARGYNSIMSKNYIIKPQIIPWLRGLQKTNGVLLKYIWFFPYQDKFTVFSTTKTNLMNLLDPREIHKK